MNTHFLIDMLNNPSGHSWRKVLTAAKVANNAVRTLEPYILAEENHFLLVIKPFGWLSQPANSEPAIADIFKLYIKEKMQKPGEVFLAPVHRLDRPVCGLLLLARTSKGAERLGAAIQAPNCEKFYTALVQGKVQKKSGYFTANGRKQRIENTFHVKRDTSGENYRIEFETQAVQAHVSLLRVRLREGKFHEIRFTLAENGYPVLGDTKYGGSALQEPALVRARAYDKGHNAALVRASGQDQRNKDGIVSTSFRENRIALMASELTVQHPIDREKLIRHMLPLPSHEELFKIFQ